MLTDNKRGLQNWKALDQPFISRTMYLKHLGKFNSAGHTVTGHSCLFPQTRLNVHTEQWIVAGQALGATFKYRANILVNVHTVLMLFSFIFIFLSLVTFVTCLDLISRCV